MAGMVAVALRQDQHQILIYQRLRVLHRGQTINITDATRGKRSTGKTEFWVYLVRIDSSSYKYVLRVETR